MGTFEEEHLLSRQEYGLLFPYIIDERISGILWNGRALWIRDVSGESRMSGESLTEGFVDKLGMIASSRTGSKFGAKDPVFSRDIGDISIRMIHGSVAIAGTTICIEKRKKPEKVSEAALIKNGVTDAGGIGCLQDIVKNGLSFLIHGEYGSGRLELMRFLCGCMDDGELIVCADDAMILGIQKIYPEKNIISIRCQDETPDCLYDICETLHPKRLIVCGSDVRYLTPDLMKSIWSGRLSAGLVVSGVMSSDVAESIFSWDRDGNFGRMQRNLRKAFPVWISMKKGRGIDSMTKYGMGTEERLWSREDRDET
ncbi:MAG: hypothetical protein J6P16_05870 [Eubacterium sp.]|nr:hypothetical protein [Eubacterium sp.]